MKSFSYQKIIFENVCKTAAILSHPQYVNWDPGIVAIFLQSLLSAPWGPPAEIWEAIKNSYLFSCWGYLQNSLVIDIVGNFDDVSPRVVLYDHARWDILLHRYKIYANFLSLWNAAYLEFKISYAKE